MAGMEQGQCSSLSGAEVKKGKDGTAQLIADRCVPVVEALDLDEPARARGGGARPCCTLSQIGIKRTGEEKLTRTIGGRKKRG